MKRLLLALCLLAAPLAAQPSRFSLATQVQPGFASTALGDTYYALNPTTFGRIAGNITTTRKFWCQVGTGSVSAAPAWCALVSGDIPNNAANTTGSAAKWTTARLIAGNSVDGSGNVTFPNKFILQGTTDAGMTAAQFLGALGTGILKNTTTTGVLSIAASGDFPTLNQSTTGNAATLTTPRAINGVDFNGSAPITVTADANTLSGTTLHSTVVNSSLTSVGTLAGLTVTAAPTFSALTAGSIPFAGTAGLFSQDNANLFWDNTTKRLGIGTTTPSVPLHVNGVQGDPSTWTFTNGYARFGATGGNNNIQMGGYTSTSGALWIQTDNGYGLSLPLVLNPISGHVGIGTTDPRNQLSVGTLPTASTVSFGVLGASNAVTTNSASGIAEFLGTVTASLAVGGDPNSPYGMWLQTRQLNPGYTGNTFPINLNPLGGRVGIGTTTPGAATGETLTIAAAPGSIWTTTLHTNDFNSSANTGSALLSGFGTVSGNTFSQIQATSAGYSVNDNLVLQLGGGNVGIGTSTFGTSATAVLGIANGTAPSTSPANMIQMWAEDVAASSELRVRDEAGNVTTLSPHNFSLFAPDASQIIPWSYYSKNAFLGKEVNVDIYGAVAAIEKLTGKTFIYSRDLPSGDIEDWTAQEAAKKLTVEKQRLDKATAVEVEVAAKDAAESVAVMKEQPSATLTETVTTYALDAASGTVKPVASVKPKSEQVATGKTEYRLRTGIRLDEKTGKFWRKTRADEAVVEPYLPKAPPAWMVGRMKTAVAP